MQLFKELAEEIKLKDAVSSYFEGYTINQTGLKDPNKPIGSFIFLGWD